MKKRMLISLLVSAFVLSAASCGGTATAKSDSASVGGAAEGVAAGGVKQAFAAGESAVDAGGSAAPGGSSREGSSDDQTRAGVLTGGEWRDNCNFNFWTSLLGQRDDWKELPASWKIDTANRVFVRVSSSGTPSCGLTVKLMAGGTELWQSITDSKGEAYLFAEADSKRTELPDKVIVVAADGSEIITDIPSGTIGSCDPLTIEMQEAAPMRKELDLMLMIDTTGSMGDELRYLQKELASVIDRIKNDSGVDVRLSVNFYRDKQDDYIVRDFPFTDDINTAISQLEDQRAAGGGDYPEAVTDALDNGINKHEWRQNSEKIMLLVLDAPPHREEGTQLLAKLMGEASKMGIRMIPVASSGVDTDTEFLCRSMAIATGGTYTFLTDDSGVGNSHLEPTVGNYTVEKLNDMLVRIINDYFSQEPREHTSGSAQIPQQPDVTTEPETTTAGPGSEPSPTEPGPILTIPGTEPLPGTSGPDTEPSAGEPGIPDNISGVYNTTWFKTSDWYSDSSLYGTFIIQSIEGLRHFFGDYGYQTKLETFAMNTDFSSYAVAVDIVELNSGSITIGDEGVSVKVVDGKPVFEYQLKRPETGTSDMAALFVAAIIPASELNLKLTDKQLSEMKKADDALAAAMKEIKSLFGPEKKKKIQNKLEELAAEGLIYKESINYGSNTFTFEYRVKGVYSTLKGSITLDE